VRNLLDTHIFITAAKSGLEGLSPKARKIMEDDGIERVLSAVSITEIAVKTKLGKLDLSSGVVMQSIADMRLTLLPYNAKHALRMFDLPVHHNDPFDRMLIATALAENLPLLSADRTFAEYSDLQFIKA
jgi:PIN domain nuclease of toxin-antitoxin system